MRELTVIGLNPDGSHVVCEDPETRERFTITADDKLRAAARGDLSRLGQIEIEMESTLRPREIQARIRAGATVEQVAQAAGVSTTRVERFAHPVLLERSRAAELSTQAHPILADGPSVKTLEETVTSALTLRGHNPSSSSWDAWRGDDGTWITQLRWKAGRSENKACWRYTPGSHGGTVVPLDDYAHELIDPHYARPLRSIAPVTQLGLVSQEELAEADAIGEGVITHTKTPSAADPTFVEPTLAAVHIKAESSPTQENLAEPEQPQDPAAQSATTPRAAPKGNKGKPTMPSWEDVLLGVRSNSPH
ncbi:MAG: septation protein SepH [Mycobacteriaceae bacterium]